MPQAVSYNANSIQVFEGLSHVRKRPDMYIGDTDIKGLHHLIWEILDNSIDEIASGHGSTIEVALNEDGSVTVMDDGRGIPADMHIEKGVEAVRLVFETLGAGGKFESGAYKTSGGLHGVGASVVNALSVWLQATTCWNGRQYHLKYKKGLLQGGLKPGKKDKHSGTAVSFLPDPTVFPETSFSRSMVKNRLRELAFLNKGLKIVFKDHDKHTEDVFCYKNGLVSYLEYLAENKKCLSKPFLIEKEQDGVKIEIALQYTDEETEGVYSFVNNIATTEGGKHDEGFRQALTRAMNELLKQQNQDKKRGKKDIVFQGSDTTEGLLAILSIKMSNPKFGGQTKGSLSNPEIRGIIMSIVYDELMTQLKGNKRMVQDMMGRVLSSFQYRENAKNMREMSRKVKTLSNSSSLLSSSKFSDCVMRDPRQKEIFIVEGDSAGGSAKQGRNQKFQAILPLKGKPLNVEKKSVKDVLDNEEIRCIIHEIGCGFGKEFSLDNVKSHKIIIATDADVDGSHIQLILLTFFYRYMKPLIEAGYVYIAMPPLYKVFSGTKIEYAYNDKELGKVMKKVGRGVQVQRYKGLGEMDPGQLWETTMDPDKRTLIRVSIDDASVVDRNISVFMGPKTDPRREYLKENM